MPIETTEIDARQGKTITNMPLVLAVSTATAAAALLAIAGIVMV